MAGPPPERIEKLMTITRAELAASLARSTRTRTLAPTMRPRSASARTVR